MNICIIIPAHNEEQFIEKCLNSLVQQTFSASQIIVVNDHSSDLTGKVIDRFAAEFDTIKAIHLSSTHTDAHEPGSKIIKAFYKGYEQLDSKCDIICKFDADLIFPKDYLFELKNAFQSNAQLGMYAGFCYIQNKDKKWVKENLTNNDHIRGPLKAYRFECFKDIGGLKKDMGWDTVDELLARFHGWKTDTNPKLKVKHLKPTGQLYSNTLAQRYGKALYKMDYGLVLSNLSLLKLAFLKKQPLFYFLGIFSFIKTAWFQKPSKLVNAKEGDFIRSYRWKMIRKKIFLNAS